MTALLDTTCADRILKAVYSMWRHIILQPVKLTNTLAFSIYVLLFSTQFKPFVVKGVVTRDDF